MKFIGIDPGIKTGFAVWCSINKQFDVIKTATFWEVYDEITEELSSWEYESDLLTACIVIEDPGQNKTTFQRRTNNKGMQRISRNVGANCREATLLIERFIELDYTVLPVRPTASKLDAKAFKRMTGYTKRTSQHGRDAAMLVYNMNENNLRLNKAT